MIKSQSRTNLVGGWDRLLAALKAGGVEHPELASYRRLLEEHLEKVKTVRRRQEILNADRLKTTQELNQQMTVAADTANRIRNLLIALLGPRDERLLRFGIAVLGKRRSAGTTQAEGKKKAPPATTRAR
jgi:hypothetical protein